MTGFSITAAAAGLPFATGLLTGLGLVIGFFLGGGFIAIALSSLGVKRWTAKKFGIYNMPTRSLTRGCRKKGQSPLGIDDRGTHGVPGQLLPALQFFEFDQEIEADDLTT